MVSFFLQLPGTSGVPVQIPYPTGFKTSLDTPGGFISSLLPYLFIIAGLILLVVIILSGFNMATSGGDSKKLEGAKSSLFNALVGFIIIIAAYWIIQILEYILKIQIF